MIKTLSNNARRILDSLVIENDGMSFPDSLECGGVVKIPLGKPEAGVYNTKGMLERELYDEVNAALTAIGGKWNRKMRGHVFYDDPADAIDEIQLTGQFKKGKSVKQLLGFFETPVPTVKYLVELAEIRPEHYVLEPSAGRGRIANEIIKITSKLTLVELDPKNRQHLKDAFDIALEPDFLQYVDDGDGFDRIVMNPPFAKQADHNHVLHAYSMLKPGGRLVSVMAGGIAYRLTNKSHRVRRLIEDGDGQIIQLPPGTFHESGTDVQTVVVVINK